MFVNENGPGVDLEWTWSAPVQHSGFLLGIFSRGAKSIVMQISFVILLFSDQISGRGKSFQGANCLREHPPAPPVEESQHSTNTSATRFKPCSTEARSHVTGYDFYLGKLYADRPCVHTSPSLSG